jgi:hypothetical protein
MFYERSQSLVGICRDAGTNSSRTFTLDLTRYDQNEGQYRGGSSVASRALSLEEPASVDRTSSVSTPAGRRRSLEDGRSSIASRGLSLEEPASVDRTSSVSTPAGRRRSLEEPTPDERSTGDTALSMRRRSQEGETASAERSISTGGSTTSRRRLLEEETPSTDRSAGGRAMSMSRRSLEEEPTLTERGSRSTGGSTTSRRRSREETASSEPETKRPSRMRKRVTKE